MPMITADQAQAKWARNTAAAGPSITDGVNAVTQAPGVKAAANKAGWLAGVNASADKWAQKVAAVPLSEWQASMIAAIPRVTQGVQAKQAKYGAFAAKFFPYVAQGAASVQSMPSGGLENGINRAVAMMRHNAAFKG